MAEKHSPILITESSLRELKSLTQGMSLKDSKENAYSGTGGSRSPFRTRGLDFQEIRSYQPGDDIRQIDWKTTAKHGKPFTKLFTDEKERPVYLVCDLRTSMAFASQGDFKSVVAARITMFMGWLVEQKRDRLGGLVILPDETKVLDLNGNTGTEALIAALVSGGKPDFDKSDTVSLDDALSVLGRDLKRGAMVFIISDFHDMTEGTVEILKRIQERRTISLIHIYDPMEKSLPYGLLPITDGKQIVTVDMTAKSNRSSFEDIFTERTDLIEKSVRRQGWGYLSVQTTDEYLLELMSFARGVIQ